MAFTIDFNHPIFAKDHATFALDFNRVNFTNQIAKARTFGFLRDIEYLKSQNLGLGGSIDNAIVVD
ncbi:UDP-3-O-acyl-N-acetylglucosamine deacetylase, partial [Burkholderia mallei]|uniref:UDP-3-O-acyl-N-acetylglucosamine deacetylase n=1 Tax=Burkholderia mallei TaxID=13373 RepID=UPI00211BE1FC